MDQYIKRITVKGLHRTSSYPGRDFEIQFNPGVNVVYGLNGSGKTTLLHILVNAVRLDFYRFAALFFEDITLEFTDGETLRLTNVDRDSHMEIAFRDKKVKVDEPSLLELLSAGRLSSEHMPYFVAPHSEDENPYATFRVVRERVVRGRRGRTTRSVNADLLQLSEALQEYLAVTAEYFPAFRSMSEVLATNEEEARARAAHSPMRRYEI